MSTDSLDELARVTLIPNKQTPALEVGVIELRRSTHDAETLRQRGAIRQDASSPVEEIDPWPEPVEGRDLLEKLASVYSRHVVLPDHAATAAALWIVHTYALDAATCSPILCWQSPTPRCGKTTAETITVALAARATLASNISAAAVFRFIDRYAPTLILDEADTYAKGNDELRGVLNSGHARAGAYVIRCDGEKHEPRRFSTWGAKSIALIGRLPATLQDRSIVLLMRRKLAKERIERLPLDPSKVFLELRRRCDRWVDDHLDVLQEADPQAPVGLNDRASDNWRPLLAIAEAAGGDWPERARAAAVALSGGERDADGAREQLLADIYGYFHPTDDEGKSLPAIGRVRSHDLADALAALEGRPWADWKAGRPITPNQIARLLADFVVVPKTLRFDRGTAKGYEREQFEEAFARYLPQQDVTTSQPLKNQCCDASGSVTDDVTVTVPEPSQPHENQHCDTFTVQSSGELNEEAF